MSLNKYWLIKSGQYLVEVVGVVGVVVVLTYRSVIVFHDYRCT